MDKQEILASHIEGVFTEAEHHRIAAKLKAMSDEWDEIELDTGVKPPEAFDYSFGLIMSKELILASLPQDASTLKQKIEAVKWQ